MAKAKTAGKAIAAAPAAAPPPPAPRLVGDEAPLTNNMGPQGEDHPFNPANEPAQDEADAAQLAAQTSKLADFLLARPDFAPNDNEEGVGEAAIRIITELDARIAELVADPAAAARKEAKRAHGRAAKGEVAVLADLPDTASLTLRFAEDGDRFIPTIPPIEIARGELSAAGGRGVLERAIDFPPDLAPALIRSAWLIAGAKSVKCELSGGLRVGGGHAAKLPKGHLIF